MRNPIRNVNDLMQYQVNRKDQMEVVRQSLYDYQTYALAGVTGQILFFQVPQGQGSPAKTFADTNMTIAGSLPSPQRFLVQAIEIYFIPGVLPSVAPSGAAIDNFVDDVWKFYTGASSFRLFIGSKIYLEESLPMRFPPFARFDGFAGMSDATTAGASLFERTSYMTASGRPYVVDPPVLLEPTQNFSGSLNYPAAVAVSANAKVGVVFNGVLVRNSQ